jgi:nitroreductase
MKSTLLRLVKYAILAPSGHNSQPWLFRIVDSTVTVLPDYTKTRPEVDPYNRELFISLGAAARNLEIAAEYEGLMYEKVVDNDKVVYKFSRNGKTLSKNENLFMAIKQRVTNRGEYFPKPIEKTKIKKIREIEGNGAFLKIIEDKENRQKIAALVSDADKVWYKSKSLVKELEGWLRDDLEASKDGLPTGVLSLYKVAVELKYLFSGDDDFALKRAKRDAELATFAPLLIVLTTKTDKPKDWIEAGMLYETLALKLTSMGLSNGFFNVVIQLKKFRKDLSKQLKIKGFAQLFLRVGYAKEKPLKTKRRPISEVLL